MPDPGVVLPLGIFVVMVALVIALVRRVVLVGGRVRRDAATNRSAADVARRADAVMGQLAEEVDGLRRNRRAPGELAESLAAAFGVLGECSRDAMSLSGRQDNGRLAQALAHEIDRATRAIEMIDHGRELLAISGAERVGEGETEVKRGYLNLLHARDAMRLRLEEMSASSGRAAG